MCDFIRKLDGCLPTPMINLIAQEGTGIVSIKLYLII